MVDFNIRGMFSLHQGNVKVMGEKLCEIDTAMCVTGSASSFVGGWSDFTAAMTALKRPMSRALVCFFAASLFRLLLLFKSFRHLSAEPLSKVSHTRLSVNLQSAPI